MLLKIRNNSIFIFVHKMKKIKYGFILIRIIFYKDLIAKMK